MKYDIWIEGYCGMLGQGEYGLAKCLGTQEAESFEEACKLFATPAIQKDFGEFTENPPALWGCKLFDNERDARKFEKKLKLPKYVPHYEGW